MDASLALVPVHAFPPFFPGTNGLLVNHNHNSNRFAREAEHMIYECGGLDRIYGSDRLETVRSATGMLIDIYI